MDIAEARDLIDAISDRTLPLIWQSGETIRVLNPDLQTKEKILAVLYHSASAVSTRQLCDWVEYSNYSVFRHKVLPLLHRQKLIEYDRSTETVVILPPGEKYVEDNVPLFA